MSRNAAAVGSGRTNRRFIFLAITLGLIGAVLVYVATNRDSSTGGAGGEVTPNTPVIVAKADIPARTTITAGMIEVRNVQADAKSALALGTTDEVVGQVTRFPIAANEQVTSSKIVSLAPGELASDRSLGFVVPPGKRAIAVTVSPIVAAGGLVLPGDYIDVMFTPSQDFATRSGKSIFYTQTLFKSWVTLVFDGWWGAGAGAGGEKMQTEKKKRSGGGEGPRFDAEFGGEVRLICGVVGGFGSFSITLGGFGGRSPEHEGGKQ